MSEEDEREAYNAALAEQHAHEEALAEEERRMSEETVEPCAWCGKEPKKAPRGISADSPLCFWCDCEFGLDYFIEPFLDAWNACQRRIRSRREADMRAAFCAGHAFGALAGSAGSDERGSDIVDDWLSQRERGEK